MPRWIVSGSSSDPNKAIEAISDILPLENSRVNGDQYAVETKTMDGWRNRDTAGMNQLYHDGVINSWDTYNDDTGDNRIMKYGR